MNIRNVEEFNPVRRLYRSAFIEQMPDGRKSLDHIGYDWD